MDEHMCEYEIDVVEKKGGFYNPWSGTFKWKCKFCGRMLPWEEAKNRINDYERLKRATDALMPEQAAIIYHFITAEGNMADRARASILAYANILEGKE